MRQFLGIGLLALCAAVAGYFAARWSGAPVTVETGTRATLAGQSRPPFELPGLDGRVHAIAEWDGKLILLNFWATWCLPCREEMPLLNELQKRYADQGLQVIGVALDRPARVQDFVSEYGIDYPILIAGASGTALARRYGGGIGLPYSVLITRDGTIAETLLGRLHEDRIVATLMEYL